MVGASDGGVPKGAAGDEKATPAGGLPVAAVGAPSDEDEKTFRRPSPAADGDEEQTFRKPSPEAAGDAYEADESVTRIGAPVNPYVDDSVTADAPAVKRPLPVAPQDDTESVTKKKPSHGASHDDDSGGQPTAIILSPRAPADVHPSAHAGRNVIDGMRVGAGVAAARADLLHGGSDSGLRLHRENLPSGDHASLSLTPPMGLPGAHWARNPPVRATASNPPVRATANDPPPAPHSFGAHPDGSIGYPASDRHPSRYDLRIAIVAFVSFAIPFGLFLYLFSLFARDTSEEPRRAAEVVSDPSPRVDEPRLKATKAAPSANPQRRLREPGITSDRP